MAGHAERMPSAQLKITNKYAIASQVLVVIRLCVVMLSIFVEMPHADPERIARITRALSTARAELDILAIHIMKAVA